VNDEARKPKDDPPSPRLWLASGETANSTAFTAEALRAQRKMEIGSRPKA